MTDGIGSRPCRGELAPAARPGYAAGPIDVRERDTMTGTARYPDLDGRSVFITGGGSGIGAQIVRRFCEQGSKVAFVDIDRGLRRGAGGALWPGRA